MVSVVDTSVKYFSSLMSGMPALSGTVGALNALFSAALVNGADNKSATSLTISGGIATLAYTGSHSAQVDCVIAVSGITGGYAALNGEQKVVSIGAGVTRFATSLPDGVASGAISFKLAPLGFANPFTGPNLAAFQSTDPMGTRMYLRVDDSAALVARLQGCEVMSDINTYSGGFPTSAANASYWPKSANTNATPVQWMLIGDTRGFFLHVAPASSTNAGWTGGVLRYFGDFTPHRPGGDPYACALSYSTANNPGGDISGQPDFNGLVVVPRAATGLSSSVSHVCAPYTGNSSLMSGADTTLGRFPSDIDGKLRTSTRYIAPAAGRAPRGDIPGLQSAPHSECFDSLRFNDRVAGTEAMLGRQLIVVNDCQAGIAQSPSVSTAGATLFDITGPWVR